VSIFHGVEPVKPANCGRTGLKQGRRAGHDHSVARGGCGEKKPVQLSGVVEADEVYIVAGHKGHPDAVSQQGRLGRRRRLKGARGRGTLSTEKPPVFGLLQRGGEVVIHMLDNVQQKTIQPIITRLVAKGSTFYTDEYAIYGRLGQLGYDHHTVNHSQAE
jgi:ISXO2-like transposase domain